MTNETKLMVLYALKKHLYDNNLSGNALYICNGIAYCISGRYDYSSFCEFKEYFNQQRPKRVKKEDIGRGWWPRYDYASRLRFLNRLIKKLESENK